MHKYLKKNYFILLLVGLMCAACQPNAKRGNVPSAIGNKAGFAIEQTGDSIILTIYSPWQRGQVMQEIILGDEARRREGEGIERVVCTSATHIGFISELGMKDKVVGVSRPDRIYNLTDEERQRIVDIGDDFQPNMEALLLCKPDLIVISSYMEGDALPQQIQAFGIPVIYCNEWTETTPLARAEWIRVFGAMLGCLAKADSVYASVKDAYAQLKVDSLKLKDKSIMSGMSWRGTWYVPAGGTFMGQLFKDAGAAYRYADNPSTASIPLNLEQVIQEFADTDVWVGADVRSLAELKTMDEKHTWFKAYQTGQVYHYLKRTLPSGANDFWESGVVHPERILHDLQKVLHGDTTELYYIAPLK